MKRVGTELQQPTTAGAYSTKCLVVALDALPDSKNTTFTVDDNFKSYRSRLRSGGLPYHFMRKEPPNFPDFGKIFPITELRVIQRKYAHVEGLKFEIQHWDAKACTAFLEQNLARNSEVCMIYP